MPHAKERGEADDMPTPLGYSKVLLGTETSTAGPIYRSLAQPRDAILQDPANPDDPVSPHSRASEYSRLLLVLRNRSHGSRMSKLLRE
ncbi:putative long-chain-fatty-acid-CoA ligase [Phytophthora cinnamomi]|uniref:putative long-chain-fatty-acid-CoA ligase n=1 Tax=Phytophthora cinnamomi TaxID=4785 RepID=UPI00355951DF|nr:putative long-chain-fatty-acid-CoA ligase [Phytophthora cinnamomi]